MATDPFIELKKGLGQAPDDARFRIGSCVLTVTVDGKDFNASEFSVSYTTMGLPTAILALPIGTAVGQRAQSGQTVNTLSALRTSFKKYAPVTVKLKVVEFQTTADIGNAMKPGDYTIFEGLISSSRVASDGDTSTELQVSLIHKLVSLASGVALFSNVIYNGGFFDINVKPFINYVKDAVVSLNTTRSPEPWETFKQIAKRSIPVAAGARSAKEWAGLDPNTTKILQSFSVSLGKLEEIESVAKLRFTGPGAEQIYSNFVNLMSQVLTSTAASTNLLANAIRAASSTYCGIIFTRSKGYYIPVDELWKREDMKVVRGGVAMSQEYVVATTRDGYDITGTLVIMAMTSGYALARQDGAMPGFYRSWLIPGLDPTNSNVLIDTAVYPAWLDGLVSIPAKEVVREDQPDKGSVASDKVRPMVHGAPSQAKTEPAADVNKGIETTQQTSEHFAFYNTMVKNLGASKFSFVTALRDDIVPGINLAVDTTTPDGEKFSVYGLVSEVTMSISANRSAAFTQVNMQYVRDEAGQDIVDNERKTRPHFAWLSAVDKLNSLRLWQ